MKLFHIRLCHCDWSVLLYKYYVMFPIVFPVAVSAWTLTLRPTLQIAMFSPVLGSWLVPHRVFLGTVHGFVALSLFYFICYWSVLFLVPIIIPSPHYFPTTLCPEVRGPKGLWQPPWLWHRRKAAGWSSSTVCEHPFASRLVPEHLPALEMCWSSVVQQLHRARVQLKPRSTPSTTPVSHTEPFLLKLLDVTSTARLDVSCLSSPNMPPSPGVLHSSPQKQTAKLQVISVVAGLGLTSLAFIRNTSLSLCWYKST